MLQVSRRFGELIRKAGAKPALYSVWPARARSFDFPNVAETYALAARTSGGLYFPVTDAWQRVQKRDRSIPLYGEDGFHPTVAGTYLAAMVIHRVTFGDLPSDLPPIGGLSKKQVAILRDAAERALSTSTQHSAPSTP